MSSGGPEDAPSALSLGVVAIGRNEGARLTACLESLSGLTPVVYVDSGSEDDSVARAQAGGAIVERLDPARPFSAARGRNAGLRTLAALPEPPDLVLLIDGDCLLDPGFLPAARRTLSSDDSLAIVCGRLRERFPEASLWNQLADLEWNTALGEMTACGGIALTRREALAGVGGFREDLVAGEEPELCLRLARAGWRIWRIDQDMAWHDAAMTRFSQWWRRAVRAGWAAAEGYALHGQGPERYNRARLRSTLIWALALPAMVVGVAGICALAAGPLAAIAGLALLPLAWGAQMLRIARGRRRDFGDPPRLALLYGLFTMLAKPAELLGALRYWRHRQRGGKAQIIEYKTPAG